jgi:DNA repair exonuclease SbcCD nuclease subunit
MKIAILGDTHFGASKSSDRIHDHFEKFYEFFFDQLHKKNITHLIQEGDLFDIRREVQFNTIYRSNKYFFDKLDAYSIQMFVIAGNHDVLHKNTNRINSINSLLGDKVNIQVIDMVPQAIPFGDVTIDMYPWINQENLPESLSFANQSNSKYAIGHFEFVNFPMHPGTMAETGMNHKDFSRYETVFSGHYHTISQKDNILYTGTPCELTWSDCGDPKGFWILDTETGEYEHIKNPFTLFEKITYIEGMVYDFAQVKDKYIKIVVADKKDQKKFDKFVDNVNHNQPYDVKIIEAVINEAVHTAVDMTALASTHNMIADVVDNIDTALDKSRLKHTVLDLYAEALALTKTL